MNPEIAVNENISHPGDIFPGNSGVPVSDIARNMLDCFTYDFKPSYNGILNLLVFLELLLYGAVLYQIHLAAKRFLKLQLDADKIQQADVILNFHQNIKITGRGNVTPGKRAE